MVRAPRAAAPPPPPEAPRDERSNRERIVDALMALLAERAIEDIDFNDISSRAGVPLADCRAAFGSVFEVLAAHYREVDRKVLAGAEPEMAEEPPRERLFDVLMRRLEVLAPHKAAVRSLMRSAYRNPAVALALNQLAVRSHQWMLTAAGIDASGTRGAIRAQGLACLFSRVIRVWLDDDDPGLARTLAELDRQLARGAWWGTLLDDLCRLVPRFPGTRYRRRERPDREEPIPV